MNILLFEDYNKDDENDKFVESLDECISACQRCIDEFGEEADHMDMIDACQDCINISQVVKELIENDSKLLKSQCQIHKLAIKQCIDQCKQFDDESSLSCIESCKRCLVDCENTMES
ncbi:MAG: putative fusion protein [uncultured marine phage]|uniref:Putative fusion protein n=1 Tax=uncultured marine phage TaxID=707152 RepID=A0A8D9FR86_9VIRU|nr:MAG: putative fusion protein [uncultured marine phage]